MDVFLLYLHQGGFFLDLLPPTRHLLLLLCLAVSGYRNVSSYLPPSPEASSCCFRNVKTDYEVFVLALNRLFTFIFVTGAGNIVVCLRGRETGPPV